MILEEFIQLHRDEILSRSRKRVQARNTPDSPELLQRISGLPVFLNQLGDALHKVSAHEVADHSELTESATQHGQDLFHRGLTIAQVVHDYGDLCQVITGLAVEKDAIIAADEFRILNLCLDDAIAGAVTEYGRQRELRLSDEGTERLGFLAHELRNALSTATMSFALIKKGLVAPGGSTGAIHERSLVRLNTIIEGSLAEVRMDAGITRLERVAVWEIIEEVEIIASMVAHTQGLQLRVLEVDRSISVHADRQSLAAALVNLLQNALKFTRPHTVVSLRTRAHNDRVIIEVEDACGGLPAGAAETILQPFVQVGDNRTGLGLGLAICLKAVKSMDGELRLRDLPGRGCIFSIDLPMVAAASLSAMAH